GSCRLRSGHVARRDMFLFRRVTAAASSALPGWRAAQRGRQHGICELANFFKHSPGPLLPIDQSRQLPIREVSASSLAETQLRCFIRRCFRQARTCGTLRIQADVYGFIAFQPGETATVPDETHLEKPPGCARRAHRLAFNRAGVKNCISRLLRQQRIAFQASQIQPNQKQTTTSNL
ncbi:MAG TPA: hypothetical protein VN048_10655, partial [Verrucomicrobiae bacterium]|nr:hypothetical protein [Verrucomicrobiae bacterium]